MNSQNFEVVYIPNPSNVIERFAAKLEHTEYLEREVSAILKQHRITPTKVEVSKTKEGKGSAKTSFEGFKYKKFTGKVRGTRNSLFRSKPWKSDFSLYLLYGKEKNGYLFRSLAENSKKEVKAITSSLYDRVVVGMAKDGPINWTNVVRTGTL